MSEVIYKIFSMWVQLRNMGNYIVNIHVDCSTNLFLGRYKYFCIDFL